MKIFPSRQPFVVSEQGASCQIRFSSPSAALLSSHAPSARVPADGNRCVTEGTRVLPLFSCKRNGWNLTCGDATTSQSPLGRPPCAVVTKGHVGSFAVIGRVNIIKKTVFHHYFTRPSSV